ncbi:hypothetical protein [Pseudomonas sp. ICMP 561]|uniref:hypothetical protein n=1 Tax=Pseudomonas sp. ICMP 561 TaxID=1718918 RepID=UPI000C06927C|nr:hypothetical protein [Pseudomonas sp. ICMP 561]PHN20467.1 hypothetical protein AO242_17770 [Pseudomonas sp. ICMP 561]
MAKNARSGKQTFPSLIHRFSLKQLLSKAVPRITCAALAQLSAALALSTGPIRQMKDICVIEGNRCVHVRQVFQQKPGLLGISLTLIEKTQQRLRFAHFSDLK